MQDEAGRACDALETMMAKDISTPGRHKQAKGFVYLTGTKGMSAPKLIHQYDYASMMARTDLEARPDEAQKAEEAKAAAVASARQMCLSQGREENYSPLWAALSGVVKDMSSKCGADDGCTVYFYTDLQEISEPYLCTQILGADAYGKPNGCPQNSGRASPNKVQSGGETSLDWPAESMLPPTPASGIRIIACGTNASEDGSASKMGPMVAQRRDQAWKALFPGADFQVYGSCGQL